MPLITPEQIVTPFITGDWEDRTVDPEIQFTFRLAASDEIFIYAGIIPSVRRESVYFTPSLGAQNAATSSLVAVFRGSPASAGANLSSTGFGLEDVLRRSGVAMATFERWRITSPEQSDTVAETIYQDVVKYGLPEFSQVRTLADLIERLQGEHRHQMQTGHLAVACGLAGQRAQAEAALREFAEAAQTQQGAMLEQTRGFVSRFVEHFGYGAEYVK